MLYRARRLRTLLRACARESAQEVGKKLHAIAITTGALDFPNSFLRNAVLHMYAAFEDIASARNVFDEIPLPLKDVVDWTTLIGCCVRVGLPLNALQMFTDMRRQIVTVDEVTLISVFNASAKLCSYWLGTQAHACVMKLGFYCCIKTCNATMDMYVKSGFISEARRVFKEMSQRSLVSWTILLEGVLRLEGLYSGKTLFDEMPDRNEVSWTIMIASFLENGSTREAFVLLRDMLFESRLELNFVTLCSFLSACSQSGDVFMGRWVHTYALKMMPDEIDIMVATALINMYSKCGRIDTALRVFKSMPKRNVVTWNAMLSGLAMHGQGIIVLDMLNQMIKEVKPDDMTLTAVLSSCSHSGLVDQGWKVFYNLELLYGIKPSLEHYSCMVDLLGRAGHLEEAVVLVNKMPIPPNEVVLGSLLGSCNVHRRLNLAESVMRDLVRRYPQNTEYHILLSNMYTWDGKPDKANLLRRVLKDRGIRRPPGVSSIHVAGEVHQFSAGDKSHPLTRDIYTMLDEMIRKISLAGYIPNTACQINSVYMNHEEEKEQALFSHSEKLAVCFGLLSTKDGLPLYIFKNLRICEDCHSAMKFISLVYNREIVMRDRSRFHHFKLGSCSCLDYW